MSHRLSVLDHVRIASPCSEPWAGMTGDERVRHCARCKLNVFNISDMTRSDAEALVQKHEGRLCVTYLQRTDGTILTRDCPVGVALVRRKLVQMLSGIAAAFACITGGLYAAALAESANGPVRLRYFKPFRTVIEWLEPPTQRLAGAICVFPSDLQSPASRENSSNSPAE